MFDQVPGAVQRALGSANTPSAAPPQAGDGAPAPPAPAPALTPAPTAGAQLFTFLLLGVALLLALFVDGEDAAFKPKEGFILFAGFYVAAQAVERLFEFLLPPGAGTPQGKADRAIILGGLATLAGVGLSLWLGLRFIEAVDVEDPPAWLDTFVTGLIIGAGTKPLHDLIGRLEKKKEAAAAGGG